MKKTFKIIFGSLTALFYVVMYISADGSSLVFPLVSFVIGTACLGISYLFKAMEE